MCKIMYGVYVLLMYGNYVWCVCVLMCMCSYVCVVMYVLLMYGNYVWCVCVLMYV